MAAVAAAVGVALAVAIAVAIAVAVDAAMVVVAGSGVGDETTVGLAGIRVGYSAGVGASIGWLGVLDGNSLVTRVFAGNAE